MQLQARVEALLARERSRLLASPAHYGAIFEMEQSDFLAFMRKIRFHRDGADFVLGTAYVAEAHGGGVLALLLDLWRPEDRAARLTDRFRFEANRTDLELIEIYRGHRRQIFLPVPGRSADEIDGALPDSPQLPRMRFRFWTRDEPVETDAYKFLALLLAHESDPSTTWTNHLGQDLSVERLLRNVWEYYLVERSTERELADHSHLHLVELLLDFDRRRDGAPGVDAIKRRFLEVEMVRRDFGSEWSEILGHYVESLGHLVADRRVSWSSQEKQQVRSWLHELECDHFRDLGEVELQHLTHLLKGLRMIAQNGSRLD